MQLQLHFSVMFVSTKFSKLFLHAQKPLQSHSNSSILFSAASDLFRSSYLLTGLILYSSCRSG